MARVLLLSAIAADDENAEHLRPLTGLQESARADRFGVHSLTTDADAVDLIIFAESYGAGWHFERVRRHRLTKKHREKCFIFSSNPFVIPFLPGVYTSIERGRISRRTVSGFYVGQPPNEFATYCAPSPELPHLYSFMGSVKNAPVRRELARLIHPRGVFRDTSADYARVLRREMSLDERRDYHRRYAELTKASKFVLCPRGLSVSSIRLFETMRMGRVPVILSDGWVEPPGPGWDRFTIRVPEKNVANIPRVLEEREEEAPAMGQLAREQWLEWFSDEAAFHRMVEWCLAIKERRRIPEGIARWSVYPQYLRPFHFRRVTGTRIRAMRATIARSNKASLHESAPDLREQRSQP